MADRDGFFAHLRTGLTTVCQAWAVYRKDGVVMGFTDHDRDLSFDDITFRAESGLTARALQQTTGLAVDNTEAIGALTSAAITEADIRAGRYDGATVRIWSVNWADCDQREERFRGSLGEVMRNGSSFRAELRGLSEAFNQPKGALYQRSCAAQLGDARCRFDLTLPGYALEATVAGVEQGFRILIAAPEGFAVGWFEQGRLAVLDGAAAGMWGAIRADRLLTDQRVLELWQSLGVTPEPGDRIRLEAGCDKRVSTCQGKFGNFLNFRGFPHIPGESWLASYPTKTGPKTGGRRG